MHGSRDHQYTAKLAEAAFQRIKSLELPADPPSFDVWYSYEARIIPGLNRAIDALLARKERVSADEIDGIYDSFLGASRLGAEVERIGEEVGSEIRNIAGIVEAAAGTAARYGDSLFQTRRDIERSADRPTLLGLATSLAERTQAAAVEIGGYGSRLTSALDEIERLRAALDAVRIETRTDALTGLVNRKQFDQSLETAIRQAIETSEPLSLLMFDIDQFKAINDAWGHPLGDDVLRLLARSVKEIVRHGDVAARYGGDEFAVIFPNTNLRAATDIAERLRVAVNQRELVQRKEGRPIGRITLSCGVAQWRCGETSRDIIERADACLYAAKRQGRNRVDAGGDREIRQSENSASEGNHLET